MRKQRGLKTGFARRVARILLIALGGLLALASANCERRDVTDSAITAAVKARLAASDESGATNINVDTRGGEVTLTGVVETQAEKERAERVAAGVEGVTRVINDITVEAGEEGAGMMTVSDLTIFSKIKTRYVSEGIIGPKVGVRDGVVTLKGAVQDAQTRARAESIARATSGVSEVRNLLKVKQ